NVFYRFFFFFSSRRRHTRSKRDWSSDVCSSDLFCDALVRRQLVHEVEEYALHYGAQTACAGVELDGFLRYGSEGVRLELKLRAVDRKSTRLNSSHVSISYDVFCLKKKKI